MSQNLTEHEVRVLMVNLAVFQTEAYYRKHNTGYKRRLAKATLRLFGYDNPVSLIRDLQRFMYGK